MLKRTLLMAALALLAVGTILTAPTSSWAQAQPIDLGNHALAPALGDNAAPAQSAGGGGQLSQMSGWITWSFVNTRWMFAGNPVFSQFANFNLGARTPRVW